MADYGASLLTSIGEYATEVGTYASETATSVAKWYSGLSGADAALYGATALNVAGQAVQTGAAASQAGQQAKLGEEQAKIIETETEVQRREQRQQTKRVIAQNRAIAGASGVDPFSGSPLEMELANAFQGRLNEELTGYGGGLRARNARLGAAYARGTIPGIVAGGALRAGSSVLGDWYLANSGSSNTRSGFARMGRNLNRQYGGSYGP